VHDYSRLPVGQLSGVDQRQREGGAGELQGGLTTVVGSLDQIEGVRQDARGGAWRT
jgi:hypothetical protein